MRENELAMNKNHNISLDHTSAYFEFDRKFIFSIDVTNSCYNFCCPVDCVKDRTTVPRCSNCGQSPVRDFVRNGIKCCGVVYICDYTRFLVPYYMIVEQSQKQYVISAAPVSSETSLPLAEESCAFFDEPTKQYRSHNFVRVVQ